MKHALLKAVRLEGKIIGRRIVGSSDMLYNVELSTGQILKDVPEALIKEITDAPSPTEIRRRELHPSIR